ncbi:MAG: transglycosylase SLT domain-containing protein [Actinomycetota bacterium]|nr:transglycosylase SLT domain-containing protein [Actinomycetota bacterium]
MNSIQEIAKNNAARFDVPVTWVLAIIQTESSFNPNAMNPRDPSYGLMGIKLSTAREIEPAITAQELMQPAKNIEIGTIYLRKLRGQYGDLEDVFAAYKGGHPWAASSDQAKENVTKAIVAERQWALKLGLPQYAGAAPASGGFIKKYWPLLAVAGLVALIRE